MKKAFTLVELLVVIGILGILTAVALVAMSGTSEAALNVKCETNLRNLAAACQTYGMANGNYPHAGSRLSTTVESTGRGYETRFGEIHGWISWDSRSGITSGESPEYTSPYGSDREAQLFALTNGALWKFVSGNRELYHCPKHGGTWSYVMNEYFGWDSTGRPTTIGSSIPYGKLARADRRLLFAEMPFISAADGTDEENEGTKSDCILQYSKEEYIGFNHSSGKRNWFALVAFADGHTERINMPRSGVGEAELKELTKLLCEGKDVSFNGNTYEELQ